MNIQYGVRNWYILVMLLFMIYINGLPEILEKCEAVLYANDTLSFTEIETYQISHNNVTIAKKMKKIK